MKHTKIMSTEMGSAPLGRLIPRLALPTVASMVITSVYNIADSFFAARLGVAAAGGVGIVFSFMALMQAVGFTVALGGSTWISRLLGEQKTEEAGIITAATLWLGLVVGCLLSVVGICFPRPLCRLLGATPSLLPYAVAYARPIAMTAPFMSGCFALSCILRSYGKAAYAMVGVVTGGLLNVILDPLFMFTFSWGLAGAGYATLVGQGIGFGILLLPFLRKKQAFSLALRWLPKKVGPYGVILKNGMSSLFRQGTVSLAAIALNRMAVVYGDGGVAAMNVAGKAAGLLYSVFLGWGQGYQPVAGYCYGAGNMARMKKAFVFTLLTGTGLVSGLAVLCYSFAPQLMVWLGAGQQSFQEVGATALRAQLLFMPLVPLGVLTNMTVQAADKPVMATLLACCRQGFCFFPFIYTLPRFFGLAGLQLTQGVADALTFFIALPVMVNFFHKNAKRRFNGTKKKQTG